jgi:hypothetical protein
MQHAPDQVRSDFNLSYPKELMISRRAFNKFALQVSATVVAVSTLTAAAALADGYQIQMPNISNPFEVPKVCPAFKLPQNFVLDQQFFAVPGAMAMKIKGRELIPGERDIFGEQKFSELKIGKLEKRLLPFQFVGGNFSAYPVMSFKLLDKDGHLVASARSALWRLGSRVIIVDCHDRLIGEVRETFTQVVGNRTIKAVTGSSLVRTIGIFDAQNQLIAESVKTEIALSMFNGVLSPQFLIKNSNQQIAAEMHIEIPHEIRDTLAPFKYASAFLRDKWVGQQNGSIDPRLFIFTAAFRTTSGDKRAAAPRK